MEAIIAEGTAEEIAALVLAVQGRQAVEINLTPEQIWQRECLGLARLFQIPLESAKELRDTLSKLGTQNDS